MSVNHLTDIYNAISTLQGYKEIGIFSPLEVIYYEEYLLRYSPERRVILGLKEGWECRQNEGHGIAARSWQTYTRPEGRADPCAVGVGQGIAPGGDGVDGEGCRTGRASGAEQSELKSSRLGRRVMASPSRSRCARPA